MSQHKWVCFSCREVVRRSSNDNNVRCSRCGKACECLGTRIPIPPKRQMKRWEALQQQVQMSEQINRANWSRWNVVRIHELEKKIAQLERRKINPGTNSMLRKLRVELQAAKAMHPFPSVGDFKSWSVINRQIQRFAQSTRPMVSINWNMSQAIDWFSKQQNFLLLVFEAAQLVSLASPLEVIDALKRDPGHDMQPEDASIVFCKDFSWAVFICPDERALFIQC